jgi:hypothetical protein
LAETRESDRQKILARLEDYRQAWLATDIEKFKALWDNTHDNLTFMPMERFQVLRSWDEIVAYWSSILPLTEIVRWEVLNPVIDFLGDDHAWVFAEDSFAYRVKNDFQAGEQAYDARTSYVFRRVGDDWKLIHYEDSIQWFPSSDEARRQDAERAKAAGF